MPSAVVHLAVAGLLAAGLLGRAFGARTLVVVLAVAAVPDLDTIVSLAYAPAHRAVLHTLLLPIGLGALVYYDTRYRETSWLGARFEGQGPRVAWVSVLALALAGIGPDLFTNGANVLFPLHDQFYRLDGKVMLSTSEGLVQTFVDLSPPPTSSGPTGGAGGIAVGSTDTMFYSSGVNPWQGGEPATVERTFPVVRSGQQLLLVITSVVVVGGRLLEGRLSDGREA